MSKIDVPYEEVPNPGILKIPKGVYTMKIGCCDCGLVHTFQFQSKAPVTIIIARHERATAQRRRYGKGGLFGDEEKWKIVRN